VVADIMPVFAIFGQLLVFGLAGAIFVSRIVHDGAQRDGSSLAVQSGRMFWPVFERMFLTIWLIVSAVVVLGCLTVPAFLLVALVGILLSAPATVTLAAVAVIPCRMVWGMVSGAVERAGNGARAAICWAGLAMGLVAGSILAAAVLWFSSKYPTLSGKFGLIGLVPVSIAGLAGWRAADRQSRMQEQGAW
jgi:hypothetical protein